MNESTVDFRYFRMKGGRRATVAFSSTRKPDNSITICAGVAYRNPRDIYLPFYGEDKAYGRLVQLLTRRDGWLLAQREPEKYVLLENIHESEEKALEEFHKLLPEIVRGFVPAALTDKD